MKKIYFLFTICSLYLIIPGWSQSLMEKVKSSDVVYVTPLKNYKYYGLKLAGGLDKDGAYSFNGDFEVGDMLSVTDPNISYEIVGVISDEKMKSINDAVIARVSSQFGQGKVKEWPADLYKENMGTFNQKDIDCKYYIIIQRAAWQNPLTLSVLDANNPEIKPRIVGGTESITVTLFEKEKAGKSGKKVAKVIKNPFKDMSPDFVEYGSWDDHSKAAEEFCSIATDHLLDKINMALDELFTEMENN